MAEVVASMTVTISAQWISWMKDLDDTELWRKLLDHLCTERSIEVSDDCNVIHLSGNFEAIKDVRTTLQVEAKQALKKMEEGIMKNQKRKRILKKSELNEREKPGDSCTSDGIANDTKDHHDLSNDLIHLQVNENHLTESEVCNDKLASSDDVMTKSAEQQTNNLLHVSHRKAESACMDSDQIEPQLSHPQRMISFTDSELGNETTTEFQRQMPQIHKIQCQGQMKQSIYPLLSQECSAANAGPWLQPIHTPSDHREVTGHQIQMEQHSYPSQGQGTGHQGPMQQDIYASQGQVAAHKGLPEQQSHTSQGRGIVTSHQGPILQYWHPTKGRGQEIGLQGRTEQQSYPLQGPGQATDHQGQMVQQSYPLQGPGQVKDLQGRTEQQSCPLQGQGQATHFFLIGSHFNHQGQMVQQSYPLQGQGQVKDLQGRTEQQSYPLLGQGQATDHQGQMVQQSYTLQDQGTGHQGPMQPYSYPLHSQVTGHQRIIQPIANPVIPGQIFHPYLLSLMNKQFFINRYADDYLHFRSHRNYNALNVFVYKGDIVDQHTQVLVSSANCQLTTHGSVSEAILRAAGESIVDECRQIIKSTHGFPQFGRVVQTKAGKFGPLVEAILHAIIPTTQDFQINQEWAFNVLSQIFFQCLCLSAGQKKSVSFPAIGSEIFGLQRMVGAFACGLQTFDQNCASWPSIFTPGEIHFVSNDSSKLKTIVDTLLPLIG